MREEGVVWEMDVVREEGCSVERDVVRESTAIHSCVYSPIFPSLPSLPHLTHHLSECLEG